MSGKKATDQLVSIFVSGGALSILVLYNYPQKYWIPWLLVIQGCLGTSAIGAFYFFGEE